jgi:hypothetical protein
MEPAAEREPEVGREDPQRHRKQMRMIQQIGATLD